MSVFEEGQFNLGRVAYEGYFKQCGGKSLISGAPLPKWEDQSLAIREAWAYAAECVRLAK